MNALIVEAIVSIFIAFGVGYLGYHEGHKNGENQQKAEDQKTFDAVNAERSKQKTDAAALLEKLQAGIIAQLDEDAKLKRKIDDQAQLLDRANDDLFAINATRKLQFVAPARLKGGADRSCRAGPASPGASAPKPLGPALIQLPEPLTRDLRQLVKDADDLNVDYGKCYAWATREISHAP